MSRQEASLFFRLVSYRYGRGSLLITTNKGIRDWPEVLAGDEILATAILDRLLHHSHVLNIKGRSYRLRDLERAVERAFSSSSSPIWRFGRPGGAPACPHPNPRPPPLPGPRSLYGLSPTRPPLGTAGHPLIPPTPSEQ